MPGIITVSPHIDHETAEYIYITASMHPEATEFERELAYYAYTLRLSEVVLEPSQISVLADIVRRYARDTHPAVCEYLGFDPTN